MPPPIMELSTIAPSPMTPSFLAEDWAAGAAESLFESAIVFLGLYRRGGGEFKV